MQRIFYGFLAILFIASCGTPQTATKSTDTTTTAPTTTGLATDDEFRKQAPKAGPAPKIELGDFQDFTLDNGLRVILVENHKLPRVSYQLYVDKPEFLEGEQAGAAGLMGSMLRRATSDMTKEEIDEAIDFIGATISTSSSGAYASTITKYREDVLELMSKVILDAKFTQEDFDKVKDDALAGLKSELSNPDAIASRVSRAVVYGSDHPYGELTTEETLNNLDLASAKQVYDQYFVPNRSYLVMVGDLKRPEAERLAKQYFGDWERGEVSVPEFETPKKPDGTQVIFVPRAGSVQSVVTVTHPVELKPGSKEAIRARVVNSVLGSGFNGRLFQNLREDKGYTYGAYSSISDDKLIGRFRASTSVRNSVTDSAVYEILREMNKIATEKITEDELMRAQAGVAGSFGRALESPQRIAGYALNTVREGLDRDFYPTYLQKVQNSSANDLLEVSREHMAPENTYVIIVGDKEVADKLKRFDADGEIDFYDENGKRLDPADMAAPTDVTAKQVIMNYVDAIGGMDAIRKVKNYTMNMEAEVQGMKIASNVAKDGGTKFSNQTIMMGSVAADQRYNDGKAMMKQQGQTVPLTPELTAAMKQSAALFPVVDMLNNMDNVTLSGTEMVDGSPAYVLEVENEGVKSQHYFDKESGLQVKTIGKQGPVTITTMLSDYMEFDGVKMPGTTVLEGAAPFPIEMKLKDMKVNTEIDQTLFDIE